MLLCVPPQDCNLETVILVSPKMGISQIVGLRNSMVSVSYFNLYRLHIKNVSDMENKKRSRFAWHLICVGIKY